MLLQAPEAPRLEVGGKDLCLTKITASGKVMPTLTTLTIAQQFTNGDTLADVTYHAPLHPDWAVRKVTMRCDERTIHTIVMPNQQAKETFDQAKQDGHTAILADEIASDELRLQLANVPAGDLVEVTTEVVAWPLIEAGRGSIIIPLINGPKYGGTQAQQPYLDENDHTARHTTCELDLELAVVNAKVDVGTIADDRIKGEIDAVGQVTVTFDATPNALYHEDEQGKYLVIGVPAMRPDGAAKKSRKAILLDRSGSMGGQGLTVAAEMGRQISDRIKEELQFVYTFDSSCEPIWAAGLGLQNGRRQSISAVDAISHVSARGGTELNAALQRIHADLNGQIDDLILITDALVSQRECGVLVRSVRQLTEAGVAVHVIVVGAAPGRFIGDAISQAGGGLYLEQTGSTYDKQELADNVTRFLQGGSTLEGIIIDGDTTRCKHPVRGRPVMVAATPSGRPSTISVNMDGHQAIDIPITDAAEARFIWARESVLGTVRAAWATGDSIEQHKAEIEKIGVDHQILTPFTSMVGLDPSQVHDRSNVNDINAAASLPVGIDASAFYGMNAGGNMSMNAAGALSQMRTASRGLAVGQSNTMYMASASMGGERGLVGSRSKMMGGTKSAMPRGITLNESGDGSWGMNAATYEGLVDSRGGDEVTQVNYCGKPVDSITSGDMLDQEIADGMGLTKAILSISGPGDGAFPGNNIDATPNLPDNVGNRAASLLAAIMGNTGNTDPLDGIDIGLYGVAAIIAAVNALRNAGANDLADRLARHVTSAANVVITHVNITHDVDKIDVIAAAIATIITAAGATP